MLVEEARVEVEDPLADDVEAEVPRLDHAGVDRADGDLVGVVAAAPAPSSARASVVLDERPQRLVAVEADAVEVVRLALVPVRGRGEVDDRRHRAGVGLDRLDPRSSPSGVDEHGPHDGAAGRDRVEPGEATSRSASASCTPRGTRCVHGHAIS